MLQLSLFEPGQPEEVASQPEPTPVHCSEELLDIFQTARLNSGAHQRTVAREVSQLRSIARESRSTGGPSELTELFSDLKFVANALIEPSTPIARSTGRARLIAAQRYIRIISPLFRRNADSEPTRLDALLPASKTTSWHTTGILVGGSRSRSHRRPPTLDSQDLHRIVHSAENSSARQPFRDKALIALHCFSGLHPEEIASLTWENVETAPGRDDSLSLEVSIVRGSVRRCLPLPVPAAMPLVSYANSQGGSIVTLTGAIFRRHLSSASPLSYRAVRNILKRACKDAGLLVAEAVDLRAAFAYWLRTQGLSDHETALALGLERVRSVDRLLKRHHALDSQRRTREMLNF